MLTKLIQNIITKILIWIIPTYFSSISNKIFPLKLQNPPKRLVVTLYPATLLSMNPTHYDLFDLNDVPVLFMLGS